MQKTVSDEWEKMTNCRISEGFGMTESSPVITANPCENSRVLSIGIPVPSTYVRIVDPDNNPLA